MTSIVSLSTYIPKIINDLKPPVSNKLMFNGKQLKIMILGGPNQRDDFHVEDGEELFIQLKGSMDLNVMSNNFRQNIRISEMEMFLLPVRVPHSPQRYEHTIGIVVERTRLNSENDKLVWYYPTLPLSTLTDITTNTDSDILSNLSSQSGQILYEESFYCEDLGVQLKPVIERFFATSDYEKYIKNMKSVTSRVIVPAYKFDGTSVSASNTAVEAIDNNLHTSSTSSSSSSSEVLDTAESGSVNKSTGAGLDRAKAPFSFYNDLIMDPPLLSSSSSAAAVITNNPCLTDTDPATAASSSSSSPSSPSPSNDVVLLNKLKRLQHPIVQAQNGYIITELFNSEFNVSMTTRVSDGDTQSDSSSSSSSNSSGVDSISSNPSGPTECDGVPEKTHHNMNNRGINLLSPATATAAGGGAGDTAAGSSGGVNACCKEGECYHGDIFLWQLKHSSTVYLSVSAAAGDNNDDNNNATNAANDDIIELNEGDVCLIPAKKHVCKLDCRTTTTSSSASTASPLVKQMAIGSCLLVVTNKVYIK